MKDNRKKILRKTSIFSLVTLVLTGCGSTETDTPTSDKFEGIQTINTIEKRKEICDNSKLYDKIEDQDLLQVMKEYGFCEFNIENKEVPELIVYHEENKELYPLDENHFLVFETTKVNEASNKITAYISDLEGNKIFGDTESNYVLTHYENDRLSSIEQISSIDGEKNGIYTFNYIDDQNYSITENSETLGYGTTYVNTNVYTYEDGRLISYEYKSEEKGKGEESVYTFKENNKYQNGNEIMATFNSSDFSSENKYVNGLIVSSKNDGDFASNYTYQYDKNGLIILSSDIKSSNYEINYYYDFEENVMYEMSHYDNKSDLHYIDLSKKEFNDNLIPVYIQTRLYFEKEGARIFIPIKGQSDQFWHAELK